MAKHSFCCNGVCRYRWAIHVIALWIRRSIHLVHSQLETFLIFTSILTLHMYIITISYLLVAIFRLCTYVYRVGGSSETPQLKLKYYVGDLPLLCVNCFVMIPTHFLIVCWQLHWIFFVFWLRKWWRKIYTCVNFLFSHLHLNTAVRWLIKSSHYSVPNPSTTVTIGVLHPLLFPLDRL